MKKPERLYLYLLFLLILPLFTFTSCGSHEKYLYVEKRVPTVKSKVATDHAFLKDPKIYYSTNSTSSGFYISVDDEVEIIDTLRVGKQMWVNVEFGGRQGWVQNNRLCPFYSTKLARVKSTLSHAFTVKGQPIAGKLAKFYEWTHRMWHMDTYAVLIFIVIVLLIWPLAIKVFMTRDIGRWWEFVIMLIAGSLAIGLWLTCDLFSLKNSGTIGPLLSIVFGLLVMTLPVAYWLCTKGLLSVFVDIEWVDIHIGITAFCFIVGVISFYLWKSVLDIVIICSAVLQCLFLLILLVKTLKCKQIMPFVWYVICYAILVLGGMILTSITVVGIISWVIIIVVLKNATGGLIFARRAEVTGYNIKDRWGNTIDSTDERGHSSRTGKDYDIPGKL